MILGTSINWKPLLLAIKEIDDSAIRDNVKGEYDYAEFLLVMNQSFPGIDARELIFCTDIFETSPKVALSINNVIPAKYSKGFVCITGHILQWRNFVEFFSDNKHIDEDVTIRCQAYRSALIKIDKDIFV
jgi:hypothetical protein